MSQEASKSVTLNAVQARERREEGRSDPWMCRCHTKMLSIQSDSSKIKNTSNLLVRVQDATALKIQFPYFLYGPRFTFADFQCPMCPDPQMATS